MREIALLAPSSVLSSGEAGVVTRFVVGALLLSHGARSDVRAILLFDGGNCVSFEGCSMRNVRPDEQSLLGIIRAGQKRLQDPMKVGKRGVDRGQAGAVGHIERRRIMQGINAFNLPLQDYVENAKGTKVFYGGGGGRTVDLHQDFTAFFQYPALDRELQQTLCRNGFVPVRLGGCQLAPDQASVVLNNLADRAGTAS